MKCSASTAGRVGGPAGEITTAVWRIDGAIGADAAGNLYATWDTQAHGRDTGWLSYSRDAGKAWSAPVRVRVRVTPDNTGAPHIVQSAGGAPGIAYVGWLDAPVQVSSRFGAKAGWPGDTFGIATLPGGSARPRSLVLTWGSAVSAVSQIFAAQVSL